MTKLVQAGEFFVVGGPVQPDRACYVERTADLELMRGIREQRFCYVFAPRASGKSSLMARTLKALRQTGQLAAVVDLAQLGARRGSFDSSRWYYAIAYRILRELRLKVDLRAWWQEESVLPSEQRLGDFFGEIVLANTSKPVTVFVDEAERALDLPFAPELFAVMRACYARRVSEPDYARLNFVVLGTASPRSLAPDPGLSPFVEGQAVALSDFTAEECLQLAAGFRIAPAAARELLERIHDWTGGHPYLTQKLARGVARKGGRIDDVERVVREQFLGPGAALAEPLLNHVRSVLTEKTPKTRQALALLGKISKGADVHDDPGSPARELLRLAGVAATDAGGRLRYRNRIFAAVFDGRWILRARPFDWRATASGAGLLAVVIGFSVWYSQFLPRPYLRTLSVVTQDFAVAEDAYSKLHRLPGFAAAADRALAAAMTRRSRSAQSYADMQAAGRILRKLPGRQALAAELEGEYWMRRARAETHAGRRDVALLLAMQALPGRPAAALGLAGELIGRDYRRLVRSFRLASPPARWSVDWADGRVTVIDAAHRAARLLFDPDKAGAAVAELPDRLTALQASVALSRDGRRAVAEPARAGDTGELSVWNLASGRLVHDLHVRAAPGDLQLDPDGSRLLAAAGSTLSLMDADSGRLIARFDAAAGFAAAPVFGRDGDFLVFAERVPGEPPRVSLVRAADGKRIASFSAQGEIRAWTLGPQARYLALLEAPRTVAVVDPRSGRRLRGLTGEHDLRRLLAAPAGDLLLTVDDAGNLCAWRLLPADGAAAPAGCRRLGATIAPESVGLSADGSTAVFEDELGNIVVRDVQGRLEPLYLRLDSADGSVETRLSPDGKSLLTANGGLLRLWRLGPSRLDAAGPGPSVMTLAADGSLAVLGFGGGHVRVRSATELARALPAAETVDYIGHRGPVTSLDVDIAQHLIASGGEDGVVRIWDLASVSPAPQFMRHPAGPVRDVEISRDGRWVASAAEYSARAWRIGDGKLTGELHVNGTARAVAISPDSAYWAAGDSAGNVFFGVADGNVPLGSVRAQGPVGAIAYAPDGASLASGDETGTVELWDTRRYQPLGRPHSFPDPIRWLGFSAGGRYLMIQTDHWLHRAELLAGGEMKIVGSRLLRVGLEADAAFEARDGSRLRLVGEFGTGRPGLLDVDFDAPAGPPLPEGSPLLERDWSRVLGLRIGDAGRVEPLR